MKRFGIRFTLPPDDPMRAPHLLGPDWETFRWYETAEERDRALEQLQTPFPYYRRGDRPSQVLSKIER